MSRPFIDKRQGGYILYLLISVVTLSIVPVAHSEVKRVQIEDMGAYSRVSIYLDKKRGYKVVVGGDREVVIEIDDAFSPSLPVSGDKGGFVRLVEPLEREGGGMSLRISLSDNLSMISDFHLRSTHKIVVNMAGGVEASNTAGGEEVSPSGRERLDMAAGNEGGMSSAEKGHSLDEDIEGLEDLIIPSLASFVEVFDGEEPLSVYNITAPPYEKLADSPEGHESLGPYDVTNPLLANAYRRASDGDYMGALKIIHGAPRQVRESAEYSFISTDIQFMKAWAEGEIVDVTRLYRELIETFPRSGQIPWFLIQIGRGGMKAESYGEAVEAYKTILEKFGDSPYADEAQIGLARCLAKMKKVERSLGMLKDFIEKNPSSPFVAEALFDAAEIIAREGKYRRAQRLFETGLRRWPDYPLREPGLLMMIGESHYRMKMFDVALKHFNRLVNLYPEYGQSDLAMARVGDIYLHLGMEESAVKVYAEVEKRYPGRDGSLIGMIRRADILVLRGGSVGKVMGLYEGVYDTYVEIPLSEVARVKAGMFLSSRGMYPEALDTYNDFMALYPKSKLTEVVFKEVLKIFPKLLENYQREGNCLDVINLAQKNWKLLEAVKEKETAFLWIGDCLFRYAQYKKAADIYGKIEGGAEHETALYMRGRSLYLAGDMDLSVKVMEEFGHRFPGSIRDKEINYLLARAYERKGDLKKAVGFLRSFLEKEKGREARADAYIDMGNLLRRWGRYEDAAAAYRRGIGLFPRKESDRLSEVYFLLGEALYESRKYREALEAYNEAISRSPGDSFKEAEYKAALCYGKTGMTDKAGDALEKLSEESSAPFWSNLSDTTLKDNRWRERHGRR